jgi:hypothetical protein
MGDIDHLPAILDRGDQHGFLATPVPEPPALILCLSLANNAMMMKGVLRRGFSIPKRNRKATSLVTDSKEAS